MDRIDFDVEQFLRRPLTARLASLRRHGPAVRPIWYLWEDGSFWWLTGPWSVLPRELEDDPRVALAVDTCDLALGEVKQVLARGRVELHPYETPRALRKLSRYLGDDPSTWDPRFAFNELRSKAMFVQLRPHHLVAKDLSYKPARSVPHHHT